MALHKQAWVWDGNDAGSKRFLLHGVGRGHPQRARIWAQESLSPAALCPSRKLCSLSVQAPVPASSSAPKAHTQEAASSRQFGVETTQVRGIGHRGAHSPPKGLPRPLPALAQAWIPIPHTLWCPGPVTPPHHLSSGQMLVNPETWPEALQHPRETWVSPPLGKLRQHQSHDRLSPEPAPPAALLTGPGSALPGSGCPGHGEPRRCTSGWQNSNSRALCTTVQSIQIGCWPGRAWLSPLPCSWNQLPAVPSHRPPPTTSSSSDPPWKGHSGPSTQNTVCPVTSCPWFCDSSIWSHASPRPSSGQHGLQPFFQEVTSSAVVPKTLLFLVSCSLMRRTHNEGTRAQDSFPGWHGQCCPELWVGRSHAPPPWGSCSPQVDPKETCDGPRGTRHRWAAAGVRCESWCKHLALLS